MLSHADRTRVIPEEHRGRLYTVNGVFPGTVLVDGFALGLWRFGTGRHTAALTIELWGPVSGKTRREISDEAERMLAFTDPGATAEILIR